MQNQNPDETSILLKEQITSHQSSDKRNDATNAVARRFIFVLDRHRGD